MKIVDDFDISERGAQMAFTFEASDINDQSYLPVPKVINSTNALPLAECKIVSFRRPPVSPAEASLLARILQRTRHFV
ncbi:hypothetical protein SAMN04490202_2819 [Pseudomonas reinekei]|uniref:Uncharacterized protein n=1 Tax=Pseudomonas reinekei TaxID=395598 RepID=A0A1H0PU33_PSERE|nr:hypothetical protein [Pseudomonas reinekei]KAB0486457.1 hypothetical protein F7R15_11135 [Pseudomonas reinekei]OLU03811.1 hypothetical protein BVK86_11050 [Pseudomonas reinekei]SDP08175.1 hypothetical protein SAMN04490202_2819 [Pseudomonas reinekei]